MSATTEDSGQKIVKFVQQMLLEEPDLSRVGRDLIGRKIDLVLAMMPAWKEGLDRDAVTDELVRRFSMWVGRDATLKDEAGHAAWLDTARKKDWRLWRRYREFMEKDLAVRAVEALDRSTDSILELLEDPVRDGNWDRRGLVVGHVQSGKTGNYTGLVCKAADAGYKIIIVLAGLHNNLRSQTQMRLGSSKMTKTIEIVNERSTEVFRLLVKESRPFIFLPGRGDAAVSEDEDDSPAQDGALATLPQPEDGSGSVCLMSPQARRGGR